MPQLRDCARLTLRRGARWDIYDLSRIVGFARQAGLLQSLDEWLNPRMREKSTCMAFVGLGGPSVEVTLEAFVESIPEPADPFSLADLDRIEAAAYSSIKFDDPGEYRFGRR